MVVDYTNLTEETEFNLEFNFASKLQEKYVNGGCWFLARELNELWGNGYMVILIGQEMYHAGALTDDGRIADIEGLWTSEQWENRWMNANAYNYPSVAVPSPEDIAIIEQRDAWNDYSEAQELALRVNLMVRMENDIRFYYQQ